MGECNLGICGDRVILNKHFNVVRGKGSVLALKLRNLRQKFNTEVTEKSVLGMWAEYIIAAVDVVFLFALALCLRLKCQVQGCMLSFLFLWGAEEYKTEL